MARPIKKKSTTAATPEQPYPWAPMTPALARKLGLVYCAKGTASLEAVTNTQPGLRWHRASSAMPGWWFPSNGVEGEPVTGVEHFRFNEPFPMDEKHSVRYLQPIGSPQTIYFPPNVDWGAIANDTSVTLYMTEGQMKAAIAAHLSGRPFCAFAGISSLNETGTNELNVAFTDSIILTNRKVVIIPDSDMTTNPAVGAAVERIAGMLLGKGAKPCLYEFEATLGDDKTWKIDDWLHEFPDNRDLETLGLIERDFDELKQLLRLRERLVMVGQDGGYHYIPPLGNNFTIKPLFTGNNEVTLEPGEAWSTAKVRDFMSNRRISVYKRKMIDGVEKEVKTSVPLFDQYHGWIGRAAVGRTKLDMYAEPCCVHEGSLNMFLGFPSPPVRNDELWNMWKRAWDTVFPALPGDPLTNRHNDRDPNAVVHEWTPFELLCDVLKYHIEQGDPMIMIVLLGAQGAGKGKVSMTLRWLYGDHSLQVSGERHAKATQFNKEYARALCVEYDEYKLTSDMLDREKNRITASIHTIEPKGMNARQLAKQYLSFGSTNKPSKLHINADDRRWTLFTASTNEYSGIEAVADIISMENDLTTEGELRRRALVGAILFELHRRPYKHPPSTFVGRAPNNSALGTTGGAGFNSVAKGALVEELRELIAANVTVISQLELRRRVKARADATLAADTSSAKWTDQLTSAFRDVTDGFEMLRSLTQKGTVKYRVGEKSNFMSLYAVGPPGLRTGADQRVVRTEYDKSMKILADIDKATADQPKKAKKF